MTRTVKWISAAFVGSFIFAMYNAATNPSSPVPAPTNAPEVKPPPPDPLAIKQYSWSKGGFENILILDVTVANQTAAPLKDFVISCTTSGQSGTQLSSVTKRIFSVVTPKTPLALHDLNMGLIHSQSVKASCEVGGAVPA